MISSVCYSPVYLPIVSLSFPDNRCLPTLTYHPTSTIGRLLLVRSFLQLIMPLSDLAAADICL